MTLGLIIASGGIFYFRRRSTKRSWWRFLERSCYIYDLKRN
jgi:hypothetical protein